jgi:hypothetical protein
MLNSLQHALELALNSTARRITCAVTEVLDLLTAGVIVPRKNNRGGAPLNEKMITTIVTEFNPELLGEIALLVRDDGKAEICRGHHRLAALQRAAAQGKINPDNVSIEVRVVYSAKDAHNLYVGEGLARPHTNRNKASDDAYKSSHIASAVYGKNSNALSHPQYKMDWVFLVKDRVDGLIGNDGITFEALDSQRGRTTDVISRPLENAALPKGALDVLGPSFPKVRGAGRTLADFYAALHECVRVQVEDRFPKKRDRKYINTVMRGAGLQVLVSVEVARNIFGEPPLVIPLEPKKLARKLINNAPKLIEPLVGLAKRDRVRCAKSIKQLTTIFGADRDDFDTLSGK